MVEICKYLTCDCILELCVRFLIKTWRQCVSNMAVQGWRRTKYYCAMVKRTYNAQLLFLFIYTKQFKLFLYAICSILTKFRAECNVYLITWISIFKLRIFRFIFSNSSVQEKFPFPGSLLHALLGILTVW
jgi:hypothetical protein